MIIYKELTMLDNTLLYCVSVEKKDYYNGITISKVRIDTPLTYGTDTPYNIATATTPTTLFIGSCPLPALNQQLLIVTPIIEGAPSPDTPCGKDIVDIGVIYNKEYILNKGLSYLKELGNNCLIPKGFIDYILRTKALDMSIATCNYAEAVKYWDYITGKSIKTTVNNCGCHGFN